MYLNSGNRGTHPLEPGVTIVRSAFRQELEIPLSPIARLAGGLVQCVLHARLRKCRVEIAHRLALSSGISPCGSAACRGALDPAISPPTIHTHKHTHNDTHSQTIHNCVCSSYPLCREAPIIMDNCSCRLLGARSMGAIKPIGLNWIIFDAI